MKQARTGLKSAGRLVVINNNHGGLWKWLIDVSQNSGAGGIVKTALCATSINIYKLSSYHVSKGTKLRHKCGKALNFGEVI